MTLRLLQGREKKWGAAIWGPKDTGLFQNEETKALMCTGRFFILLHYYGKKKDGGYGPYVGM